MKKYYLFKKVLCSFAQMYKLPIIPGVENIFFTVLIMTIFKKCLHYSLNCKLSEGKGHVSLIYYYLMPPA